MQKNFQRMIQRITLAWLILFVPFTALPAQIVYPGEVIEYNVSYIGIKLGKVKIVTEGTDSLNGKKVIRAKAFIQSNPGIPFVDIQTVYHTWMSNSLTYAHKFTSSERIKDSVWEFDKYYFEYDNNEILLESGIGDDVETRDTLRSRKKWNDGLSLFFLARKMLRSSRHIGIPSLIRSDTAYTKINFVGESEEVEIDAVDYPIQTVYFKGRADWEGVYGMSGDFEGWFSDDNARVPIRAKVKVYVGNVNIELVKWSRGDWNPPIAVND